MDELQTLRETVDGEASAPVCWDAAIPRPHPARSRSPSSTFRRAPEAPHESLSARVTLIDEYVIHDKPDRKFVEPKDITFTDGSKCHTSMTGGNFLQCANVRAGLMLKHHDGQLNTALQGELAALHEALTCLRPLDRERETVMEGNRTSLYLIMIAFFRPEEMRIKKHREIVFQMTQMVASWDSLLMLQDAHTFMYTATLQQISLLPRRILALHPFTAAGNPGRGQRWVTYKPGPHPHGLQGDASEQWADNNNLEDHVRDLGNAAYARIPISIRSKSSSSGSPSAASSCDPAMRPGNPALSPLAIYHAILAGGHRLQTQCIDSKLRNAAAPKISTVCLLCKALVDDEDHAVGGACTGENARNLSEKGMTTL